MPTAPAHAIFTGHRTVSGQSPVEVLVTASCMPEEPGLVRLCCVDEQACEIAMWSFSRDALLDGLTNPVTSRSVTLQPLDFALLFSLDGGSARRSLVQLDRAEVASFLVGLCLSGR
ncbi:SsgA family sporulation/cell division regulator [Streptomyces sp. NPDC047123]|uniref:SsgA family sporulation/cell division regulator n=1 Tax=Streptomyces sp. NPDC047123 TaxID=3155622 RepID=UPI0033F52E00